MRTLHTNFFKKKSFLLAQFLGFFFLLFLLNPAQAQDELTMNKWVKAWGYNPDGTITIKYAVRVRNNTADRLCDLVMTDDLTDAAFLQGSSLCSARQTSVSSGNPGGWYNNSGYNASEWDGGVTDATFYLNPTGSNQCDAAPMGGTACPTQFCLMPDQYVTVCYNVIIDGDGLPPATLTDDLVNQASVTAGAFSDVSNNRSNSSGLGTDNDNPTVLSVHSSCTYPGLAKERTAGPTLTSDCEHTVEWTYTICNYDVIAPTCGAIGGLPGCDATNVQVIDNDNVNDNLGPLSNTTITYVPSFGGGGLIMGTDPGADGIVVSGGTLPTGICESVIIEMTFPVCGSDLGTNFYSSAYMTVEDAFGNTVRDNSHNGLDPDPDVGSAPGPANNCSGISVQYNSSPDIDLVKNVANVRSASLTVPSDDNVFVDFSLIVTNTGDVDLNTLSVIDEVALELDTPPGCFVRTVGIPIVNNITTTVVPIANVNYNGTTDTDLLMGSAFDLMEPGQQFEIIFTVELTSPDCAAMVDNSAVVNAVDCCTRPVTDPDPPMVAFSLAITTPAIELDKAVTDGPTQLANANYEVEYTFTVTNTGVEDLDNLSLLDNFSDQFGCAFVDVLSVPTVGNIMNSGGSSVTPGANAAFDGIGDLDLLDGSGVIVPGESFDVVVSVELDANCPGMPDQPMSNCGWALGRGTFGTDVQDPGCAVVNLPCAVVATIDDISILCATNPVGNISLSSMYNIDGLPTENTTQGGTFALVGAPAGAVVLGGSTLNYFEAGCYEIMYTAPAYNSNCVTPITANGFVQITEEPQPDFEMQNEVCFSDGDADFVINPTVSSPSYDAYGTLSSVWSIESNTTAGVNVMIDAMTGALTIMDQAGSGITGGVITVRLTETLTFADCGTIGMSTCEEISEVTISLDDGTAINASFTATPNPVCESTDVILTPMTVGGVFSGTGVTDDGLGTGGTFNMGTPGIYVVTYTITSPNGCSNVSSQNIEVVPVVNATINDISACDAGTIDLAAMLDAAATPGGVFSFVGPTPPGAVISGTILSYVSGGSFDIMYTVGVSGTGTPAPADGDCYGEDTGTVTVSDAMDLSFVTTPEECPNDADGEATVTVMGGTMPYSYDWSNDGADNPDDDTATATGLTAGIYVVTVTDANGCTAEGFVVLPDPLDTEAPMITNCPLDQVNLTCGTVFPPKLALGDFTVMDNCTDAADLIFLVADVNMSVATCPSGVSNIMRTYTFIDEAGNAEQCIQMISYQDDVTPPTLTCAADFTISLDANGNVSIDQSDVIGTLMDNCTATADILVDISRIAFDKNDVGDNTVTVTATDNCGNQSTCTVVVTVEGSGDLGAAKRLVNSILQDNGCFLVTYEFNLENLGNTDVSGVQLVDDLLAAGYNACDISIHSLTSDDFTVNPAYTGEGNNNLLSGTNTLACGDKGAVLLTIEACECVTPVVTANTAVASGTGADGNPILDNSSNGTDPDPSGNGEAISDESGSTNFNLQANPDFGIAKRDVSVWLRDDGCTWVTYEINVENLGNTPIYDLQVTDDLAAAGFDACTSFSIKSKTSDDFVINSSYDGNGNNNLLSGMDVLGVGDKGAILLTVEACGCPDGTNTANQATGTGNDPGGTTITDLSVNGSDPDPSGNGEANSDEEGATNVTLTENADLGAAKRIVSTDIGADGCTDVTYEINVENLGNVTMSSIQVTDDLDAAGYGACASYSVTLTSDDFIVEANYDGSGITNLLDGSDDLNPGDKGAILLTVNACGCPDGTAIANGATVTGTSPSGDDVVDESSNGSNPDPSGNGETAVDENGTTDQNLLEDADFGVAKREVGVWLQEDGCFLVSYEINVENLGNAPILDLQIEDDLDAAGFGACDNFSIKSLTSDDFVVDGSYDGDGNNNMLTGGDILEVGDKGAILLTVEACGCPDGSVIANVATGSGNSPGGEALEDMSSSGSEVDPDGTGEDIVDETDATNTTLSMNADMGIAKRVVSSNIDEFGCSTVTFELNVENLGNVNINNVRIRDRLNNAGYNACETVVTTVTSDEFLVNPDYNGQGNNGLLLGTDVIEPGDVGSVLLTVEACGCPAGTMIANSARLRGEGPDDVTITDFSVSGSDPDPDGMGEDTDERSTANVEITEDPDFGIAKREVSLTLLENGCSIVEYEINIENLGNVNLINLQVEDDLAAAGFDCGTFTTTLTSDDFIVNAGYDGNGNNNLLSGDDILKAGDKGAILLTVEVCGCPDGSAIANSATGSATSPGGEDLEDVSNSSSDPDPDGMGEDTTDENNSTNSTLTEDADAGIAKRIVSSLLMSDGCTQIVYEFNIENLGNVNINDVQVSDDLATAGFDACDSFSATLTSDEFVVDLTYDGDGNNNMLIGTDNIEPGDIGSILLTVEACGCPDGSTIGNVAELTGTSPGGEAIDDLSSSGANPDPDGMGEDATDETDPTVFNTSEMPDLGVAKREVSVVLDPDGCYAVTYEVNVENLGNVDLSGVQVTDDLAAAGFDACSSFEVTSITSDDFIVDSGFDGDGMNNLLVGADVLQAGDKGAILFTVEACGCPDGTAIANSATASGTSPGGATIDDDSSNGSDPDPDGFGETTDESGTTDSTLEQDADMGLAKRVVSASIMENGCTEVVFELKVENLGNVNINNVRVLDRLDNQGFGDCASFTTTVTSDEFLINPNYNGMAGNSGLLLGTDVIVPGDVGSILLTVEACGCPSGTMIANTARLRGEGPDDVTITDFSAPGSNPDPDGMGEDVTDETGATTLELTEMPDMGVAKREVSIVLDPDGCYLVTYEVNVENLGNVDLSGLQVTDDLIAAGFGDCTAYSIASISSDDFLVDGTFNGDGNTNLLLGTDVLEAGDKGAILFTVAACGCPDGTAISNSATGTATSPGGAAIDDVSSSGSDPDPDGMGEDTDENSTTDSSLIEDADAGIAKRVVSTEIMENGCTEVVYEFNIENLGNININDLQVSDDLDAAGFGACDSFTATLSSDEFAVDGSYDGNGNNNMLLGSDNIMPNDIGSILLTVEACGCPNGSVISNVAELTGVSAGGTAVDDLSSSGSDPDPDGMGEDVVDETSPTLLELSEMPDMGVSKRVVSSEVMADGCVQIDYEINIENLGNVNINNIRVRDRLNNKGFEDCENFSVTVTSDEFLVDPGYDGDTDWGMLIGSDIIVPGDVGSILLSVEACGCPEATVTANQVRLRGETPGGTTITDFSSSGSNPDPDGNGELTDERGPTIFVISTTPGIGLAKRATDIDDLGNGCNLVTYEFNIENFGNVELNNMMLMDDLAMAFASCETFAVDEIMSDDFIVNPSYDGTAASNMLNPVNVLGVGDKGAVLLTVEACGCNGTITNQAEVMASAPNGDVFMDLSDSGSAPDGNGDGNPSNDMDPTETNVICTPPTIPATQSIDLSCSINAVGSVSLSQLFPGIDIADPDWTVMGSNVQGGAIVYNAPGCYDVTLTYVGFCAPDPASVTSYVFVTEEPQPSFDIQDQVCWSAGDPAGTHVYTPLINSPAYQDPVVREFTVSGPATLNNATTGEIEITGIGTVTLCLTDTIAYAACGTIPAGNCLETFCATIDVEDGTAQDATFMVSNTEPCIGETVTYTANTTGGQFSGPGVVDAGDGISATLLITSCGEFPVTYTLNSTNGCTAQNTYLQLTDVTPPMITTPASNRVRECNGNGNTGALNNWLAINGGAVATDNCTFTWSNELLSIDNRCAETERRNYRFTATDQCGNIAITEAAFIIRDRVDPVLTVPAAPLEINCAVLNGNTSIDLLVDAWLLSATATDVCDDDVEITYSLAMTDIDICAAMDYSLTVTFTATDACGNDVSDTQLINIDVDEMAPVIVGGSDMLMEECINPPAGNYPEFDFWLTNNAGATATDDCSAVIWTNDFDPSKWMIMCGNARYVDVTFTATDLCGNSDFIIRRFGIGDVTPPEFTNCPRPELTAAAPDTWCEAFVNFSPPNVIDNCGGNVTLEQIDGTGLESGDLFPVGITVLTWRATDDCGNSSECSLKIIVNDYHTAPSIIECPTDITVENTTGLCGAIMMDSDSPTGSLAPVWEDNCPLNVAVIYEVQDETGATVACGFDNIAGSELPVGCNNITYTVQDQPLLLITEIVQDGPDAVEVTNFGPASMNISCLQVERAGTGAEIFIVPINVILAPGEVYVANLVNDIDVNDPADYTISIKGNEIDAVSTNQMIPGGDIFRTTVCDHDSAIDWEVAFKCTGSLGFLNPGLPTAPDNGHTTGLQSIAPSTATCSFKVTIDDTEAPMCASEEPMLNGTFGGLLTPEACNEFVLNIPDNKDVGNVRIYLLSAFPITDFSDLTVHLESPSGTEIELFSELCSGTNGGVFNLADDGADPIANISCSTFFGTFGLGSLGQAFTPEEPFKTFYGEPAMGDWTLRVSYDTDNVFDFGILDGWLLEITELVPYAQGDIVMDVDPTTAPDMCGNDVTWTHPVVKDNCCVGTISVAYSSMDADTIPVGGMITPGEEVTVFFGLGTTLVEYTVTDEAGNTSMCSFNVIIEDPLGICIPPCPEDCEIGCKENLNLSLDQNCQIEVLPSMVGLDIPESCNDFYTVELFDLDMNPLNTTILDIHYLGQIVMFRLTEPICGNACMGELLVEDKFPPTIECTPDTIFCVQPWDDALLPMAIDNCGADIVLLDEDYQIIDCDDDFVGRILRTWKAVDFYGTESAPCVQEIMVRRVSLNGVTFPDHKMISNGMPLSCSDDIDLDENGNPDPSETGVPMLAGVGLYPLETGIICNGYVNYIDTDLGSTNCVKKIMRQWTVGEWVCTGNNSKTQPQIIEIVDFEGPDIVCPANITVSTNGMSCTATIVLDPAVVSDDCNEDNIQVDILYPGGFIENSNGGVAELPVGPNVITYIAYDDCGNSSECTMNIMVQDNADPIALCDQFTTVSLNAQGVTHTTAQAIDDGSFDECGAVELAIARMDHPDFPDPSIFGDKVDFDCTDANQDIMIGLLVTDSGGNTNMCMVSVEVQDKVDPVITCPDDVTVDCNTPFDMTDLDAFFGEATIYDNCPENAVVDHQFVDSINQCGIGTILRTFTIVNPDGSTGQSCEQLITFEAIDDPFTEDDIQWPLDYETNNGCTEGPLDPASLEAIDPLFGFPQVEDTSTCIMTGMDYVDEVFNFAANDACLKIIRTWTVIDWCSRLPDGTLPTFSHEQIIKINNVTAPVITSATDSILVCSFENDCGPASIQDLIVTATDDCTPSDDLFYRYEIDLQDDGSVNVYGNGADASGLYELGTHRILFIVEDKCGNQTTSERVFEIRNCKPPQAVCIQGLSTELVGMDLDGDGEPDAEMSMVMPSFFDASSSHLCGNPITLSFSSDVNDTIRIYDCNTLGSQPVELWVTDDLGNQSFCTTFIDVQDNNDVDICAPFVQVRIEGVIETEMMESIDEVEVLLDGSEIEAQMTEANGLYAFPEMPMGGNYNVIPEKDIDPMNGVTTLDLVLIQRHILGLQQLDSPYKLMAADINNSEGISAGDLIELRKLILGVYDNFPSNSSWRFIDMGHTFADPEDPWAEYIPEQYNIPSLDNNMYIDFIGVKVGDVNGSVTANVNSSSSEVRNATPWTLKAYDRYVVAGEEVEVEIYTDDQIDVHGWQYTIEHQGLALISVESGNAEVSAVHIRDTGRGSSWMSFNAAEKVSPAQGRLLYTMKFVAQENGQLSQMIDINSSGLDAEVYVGGSLEIRTPELDWIADSNPIYMDFPKLMQNEPNPWYEETAIKYYIPAAGEVQIIVKDVTGRVVKTHKSYHEKGEHLLQLQKTGINASGVLFYEMHYDGKVMSNKMLLIR